MKRYVLDDGNFTKQLEAADDATATLAAEEWPPHRLGRGIIVRHAGGRYVAFVYGAA